MANPFKRSTPVFTTQIGLMVFFIAFSFSLAQAQDIPSKTKPGTDPKGKTEVTDKSKSDVSSNPTTKNKGKDDDNKKEGQTTSDSKSKGNKPSDGLKKDQPEPPESQGTIVPNPPSGNNKGDIQDKEEPPKQNPTSPKEKPETPPTTPETNMAEADFNKALANARRENAYEQMFRYFEEAASLCSNNDIPNCQSKLEEAKAEKFKDAKSRANRLYNKTEALKALKDIKFWFCSNSEKSYCKQLEREIEELDLELKKKAFEEWYAIAKNRFKNWPSRLEAVGEAYKLSQSGALTSFQNRVEVLIKDLFAQALEQEEGWEHANTLCGKYPSVIPNCTYEIHFKTYNKYIQQGQATEQLQEKIQAFEYALNICVNHLSNTSCKEDVDVLIRSAYLKRFEEVSKSIKNLNSYQNQRIVIQELSDIAYGDYGSESLQQKYTTQLRAICTKEVNRLKSAIKNTTGYNKKLSLMASAKAIGNQKGILTEAQVKELDILKESIHLGEIRRLITFNGGYDETLQKIGQAEVIMNKHYLDQQIGNEVIQAKRKVHTKEIQGLIDKAETSDLRSGLTLLDRATGLTPYLEGEEGAKFTTDIYNTKKGLVRRAFEQQKAANLPKRGRWKEAVRRYNKLIDFADEYSEFITISERDKLKQDRAYYLKNEYESLIENAEKYIKEQRLRSAYNAFVASEEIANSNLLNASFEMTYSRNQIPGKIYNTAKRAFDKSLRENKWSNAKANLSVIKDLEDELSFSGDIPHWELANLYKIDYFEYLLTEAERNADSPKTQKTAYSFLLQAAKAHNNNAQLYPAIEVTRLDELIGYVADRTLASDLDLKDEERFNNIGVELEQLDELITLRKRSTPFQPDKVEAIQTFAAQYFEQHIKNTYEVYGKTEKENASGQDNNINIINTIERQIDGIAMLSLDEFKPQISEAAGQLFSRELQQMKGAILAEEGDLSESLMRIPDLKEDYANYLEPGFVDQKVNDLHSVVEFQQGNRAYEEQSYVKSLEYFDAATDFSERAHSKDTQLQTKIQEGKRLSLSAYVEAEVADIDTIFNEGRKAQRIHELLSFRRKHSAVELSPALNDTLKQLGQSLVEHQCKEALEQRDALLKDADKKAEAKQYIEAVQLYSKADTVGQSIALCGFDNQNIKDQLAHFQPAATFMKRNQELDQLIGDKNYEALATAYTALWKFHGKEKINERFGLELQSIGEYLVASKDLALQKYFVVNYAAEPEWLNEVNTVLHKMINNSGVVSSGYLTQLAEVMVPSVYKAYPDKSWKNGFKYFDFKPQANGKSNYKAFVKGWKGAWKENHKNAGG